MIAVLLLISLLISFSGCCMIGHLVKSNLPTIPLQCTHLLSDCLICTILIPAHPHPQKSNARTCRGPDDVHVHMQISLSLHPAVWHMWKPGNGWHTTLLGHQSDIPRGVGVYASIVWWLWSVECGWVVGGHSRVARRGLCGVRLYGWLTKDYVCTTGVGVIDSENSCNRGQCQQTYPDMRSSFFR
jgi:hypothetical protein